MIDQQEVTYQRLFNLCRFYCIPHSFIFICFKLNMFIDFPLYYYFYIRNSNFMHKVLFLGYFWVTGLCFIELCFVSAKMAAAPIGLSSSSRGGGGGGGGDGRFFTWRQMQGEEAVGFIRELLGSARRSSRKHISVIHYSSSLTISSHNAHATSTPWYSCSLYNDTHIFAVFAYFYLFLAKCFHLASHRVYFSLVKGIVILSFCFTNLHVVPTYFLFLFKKIYILKEAPKRTKCIMKVVYTTCTIFSVYWHTMFKCVISEFYCSGKEIWELLQMGRLFMLVYKICISNLK